MKRTRDIAHQRGAGLLETLVTLTLAAVLLAVALPHLQGLLARQRLQVSASRVQTLVHQARFSALKEKTAYRILVHDEAAATPNRLEVQRRQGASFVTLPRGTHVVSPGVRILGAGSTDSMDQMTFGRRGECTAGRVYLRGQDEHLAILQVEPTCHTHRP